MVSLFALSDIREVNLQTFVHLSKPLGGSPSMVAVRQSSGASYVVRRVYAYMVLNRRTIYAFMRVYMVFIVPF